jgi:hypothetical protein
MSLDVCIWYDAEVEKNLHNKKLQNLYPSAKITIYLSMTLQTLWTLAAFSVSWSIHRRWDSLDGGSARSKAATYTQNNTNTEQTHTDIHAASGIGTHDPRVPAGEDGSCLRPRGHCDWSVNITSVTRVCKLR